MAKIANTNLTVTVQPEPAKVPVGLSTYFGYGFAILAAVASIYSGFQGNDTATITAGITALLTAVQTGGGRQAQAVAQIRAAAATAAPFIDAVQEGVKQDEPVS